MALVSTMRVTTPIACFVLLAGVATAFAQTPPQGRVPTALAQACKADVERLCPGTEPGGGRIAACLRQNVAGLSQTCRDAAIAARGARGQGAPSP